MASDIKIRGGHRARATSNIDRLKDLLHQEVKDKSEFISLSGILIDNRDTLKELDKKIQATLDDEDFIKDLLEADNRQFEINKWIIKAQEVVSIIENPPDDSINKFLNSSNYPKEMTGIHLPTLKLPTFNGDPINWQQFWDIFRNSIHERNDIAGAQKFAYLKGQLEDEALQLIEGFSTTDNDYIEAIELLKSTYGKPYQIIQAHLYALFDISNPGCSSVELRKFRATYESHLRSLKSLGVEIDQAGFVFVAYLLRKLPSKIKDNLNRAAKSDSWNLEGFRVALDNEISLLQAVEPESSFKNKISTTKNFERKYASTVNGSSKPKTTVSNYLIKTHSSCKLCFKNHSFWQCTKYNTPSLCVERAKELNLCFSCLANNHKSVRCPIYRYCKYCGMNHNTIFCKYSEEQNNEAYKNQSKQGKNVKENALTNVASITGNNSSGVALPTALTTIVFKGRNINIRALFDQGSQKTFMLRTTAVRYGFRVIKNINLKIEGFNAAKKNTYEIVKIYINTSQGKVSVEAILVDRLPNVIDMSGLKQAACKLKDYINLADTCMSDCVTNISLLIGADYYYDFVLGMDRKKGVNLLKSNLGYMVSGKLSNNKNVNPASNVVTVLKIGTEYSDLKELNERVKTMWELESVGISPPFSIEGGKVLEDFCNKIVYEKGQYTVELPWRSNKADLPTNYNLAKGRLESLLKGLRKGNQLGMYNNILQEYLKKNFIEEIKNFSPYVGHYLPHHAVHKESETTPLRIVFDCSAGRPSLNDYLHTGPILINEIVKVLMRFRLKVYACTGDIAKAYLMINLHKDDQDYMRFLWPEEPNKSESPLKVFRFKVVLFGATSSQFLLNATIMYHLNKYKCKYSKDILRNLYVDNVFYTSDNEIDLLNFQKESKKILSQGNFHLRSWSTNSQLLRDQLNEHDRELKLETKVLGLVWDKNKDLLYLNNIKFVTDDITKRTVLSDCSKIYDPLGFWAPFTIRLRIFLQLLWLNHFKWDEILNPALQEEWYQIANDVSESFKLKIQRCLPLKGKINIHAFGDASDKAYGAVVYMADEFSSHLVMAKAKVAPIKTKLTVPQLELTSVVIAARLIKYVMDAYETEVTFGNIYIWSDSQIALSWLCSHKRLKVFIANRINDIFSLLPNAVFKYVNSRENPADMLTRGTRFCDFQSKLWWTGPEWLLIPREWPSNVTVSNTAEEMSTVAASVSEAVNETVSIIDMERFGSFERLLKVMSLVLRFIGNISGNKVIGHLNNHKLTAGERENALVCLIKQVQVNHYREELIYLEGKPAKGKETNLMKQLGLFLDEGIIRCRGRLEYSYLSYNAKYPILLPKKGPFTKLLIMETHHNLYHMGVSSLVNELRQRWWIPQIRQSVKSVLRKCIICKKFQGKSFRAPPLPPFPSVRVAEVRPFYSTGVDFTGALYCRDKVNKRNIHKVYICLFTCMVTRAVHLELAVDNSAETFICIFRKFISRRSNPRYIYSDNALNFRATASFFRSLKDKAEVRRALSKHNCEWKFIPGRAPWMGGFWERLIGLTKRCLQKTLGNSMLTLQELDTVVAEIESHLNDRPLTYVSGDINDSIALTPSQLMFGYNLNTPHYLLQELKFENKDALIRHLSYRYRRTIKVKEEFWKRWEKEYLLSLRERQRRQGTTSTPIKRNDIVLIKQEGLPKKWNLGKVMKLHEGRDGNVRSVDLKTSTGIISRPVTMLYPLELEVENFEGQTETATEATIPQPLRQSALKARHLIKSQLSD